MKVLDLEQGSTAWMAARMGVVTASELDSLVTPLFKAREGKGVQSYLYQKIAEKRVGIAAVKDVSTFAMNQGVILEQEARPAFAFIHDVSVRKAGFVTTDDGRCGCSPDGLIGDDSGLELKCPTYATHLQWLLEGVLPADHAAQVHGSMYVTGASSWYFMSYSRQWAPFILKVERDERIQAAIHGAVTSFLSLMDKSLARLQEIEEQFHAGRAA